jgi:hypothetical protein
MLDIGRFNTRDCSGLSRRAMLQVGACSALGLGLPQWLAKRAVASETSPQAKSVLLLWLWGGPSHHETWDPKPNAPVDVRGSYRPIATATPGTQICELLPLTAQRTDKFAIVRSMAHEMKDHNQAGTVALTGSKNGSKASGGIPVPGRVRPSMGSLVSYLSRDDAPAGWPSYTVVGPNCKVSGADLRGQSAGSLGPAHDPFRVQSFDFENGFELPGALQRLGELPTRRLQDRGRLLADLDAWQRQADTSAAVDRLDALRQQALGMLTAPETKKALRVEDEPEQLRDRYGRTVFGQNCLLGRRLIEAGVPFVQLNWSGDAEDEQQGGDGGWDLHYRLFERMQDRYCPIFDRAFSALLDDLDSRGLLDTTLVLAMGEFGRSPKISSIGGREHWPFGYSMVVAGGGTPGGKVVGASTNDGGYPATTPIHPVDVIATITDKLGLDRIALFEQDVAVLGTPIEALQS